MSIVKIRAAYVILLVFLFSLSLGSIRTQELNPISERPDISTIEKNLFDLINKERAKRNLTPLELSSALSDLARIHSNDMAERQELSVLSSTGKTYRRRLTESGFYFMKIGENVVFSETFQAEFIHQELVRNPAHTDNLLEPSFDKVGIGVVYKQEMGYYISQDFLQSLKIMDTEKVEHDIQIKINELRKDNQLLPFLYNEKASESARDYSTRKAKGLPLPHIADEFGETFIHFIISPLLLKTKDLEKKVLGAAYVEAGIGVWFGRNTAYPGGAYFITMFLFPESRYKGMANEDIAKIVFEEVNKKRKQKGILPLKWDKKLSREAAKISKLMVGKGEDKASGLTTVEMGVWYTTMMKDKISTFITENPLIWPSSIGEKIEHPFVKRIGIGVSARFNPQTRRDTYWVSIITKD